MVARTETDWETRLWHLTHDLVVRMAVENASDGVEHDDAVYECLRLASTTVNTYRAAVERSVEANG